MSASIASTHIPIAHLVNPFRNFFPSILKSAIDRKVLIYANHKYIYAAEIRKVQIFRYHHRSTINLGMFQAKYRNDKEINICIYTSHLSRLLVDISVFPVSHTYSGNNHTITAIEKAIHSITSPRESNNACTKVKDKNHINVHHAINKKNLLGCKTVHARYINQMAAKVVRGVRNIYIAGRRSKSEK